MKKLLEKVLPEYLTKPMNGESLDPNSEEFAKNQALGRAICSGGLTGMLVGGVGTAILASGKTVHPGALILVSLFGAAMGAATGTAMSYPGNLEAQLGEIEGE